MHNYKVKNHYSKKCYRFLLFLFCIPLTVMLTCCRKYQNDCKGAYKPVIEIASKDNKRYLQVHYPTTWFVIFENTNKFQLDACYDITRFHKEIYPDASILIDTSFIYKYSVDFEPLNFEIVKTRDDLQEKDKIVLETNKKYAIYFIPQMHASAIYYFTYNGEKILFID